MMRAGIGLILLGFGTAATPADTDWGIREIGKPAKRASSSEPPVAGTWAMDPQPSGGKSVDMSNVKQLGSRWGRVTSTYRSPEHNRRVGGVANSYHLRSRPLASAASTTTSASNMSWRPTAGAAKARPTSRRSNRFA